MKKRIIIIVLILFSNLAFTQDVTKIVIVDKPIKYVYRVTLESLNKCITTMSWKTFVGAYYDDNDTASIYDSGIGMGHSDSYKLKKIDKEHTEINYYKEQCLLCSTAMAEAKLEKTLLWIKEGDRDCQVAESTPTQNIIK